MPTQLFQQLPWIGGLNTSIDESMIPANQLTVADHVIFDTRGSRKKRDGINFNWDSNTSGVNSIIGLHDFWFGTTGTRSQRQIGVTSDRKVYAYSGGTATQLTDGGTAWTGTLTSCSMLTYGNKVFIAVNGSANVVKYWDGSSSKIYDLYSRYSNVMISRASSGTTRTIVFDTTFGGANGTTFIMAGSGDPTHYDGTFTVTGLSTTTVSNDTITYTATGSLSESTAADTAGQVGSPGPLMSILREHLQRIWGNDKAALDNVNYSPTDDPFLWGGYGDSGGFPIGQGDGDPSGVTAIFPTFNGNTFIAKQTKLYRIDGLVPETWQFTKISDGIGCVSHTSIAPIDQTDVYFVSEKGVHSLVATQAYGDFTSSYVSVDIQKTFNGFNKGRLKNVWAAYCPNINSVAFSFSSAGSGVNDSLYLYNIPIKAWFRWPSISCQSLIVATDTDQKRFYFGSKTGRVGKSFISSNSDKSEAGVSTPILFHLTTGQIFVDGTTYSSAGMNYQTNGSAYTTKAFKRFIVFYKPTGTHTLTVTLKIDNISQSLENTLSFTLQNQGALVGSTFIVGTSLVGGSPVLGPYSRMVDGYGKGVKIDFQQSGTDEAIEIQGFALEYESAGTPPEIIGG